MKTNLFGLVDVLMVLAILAAGATGCLWPGQEKVTGPTAARARTIETTTPDGKKTVTKEEVRSEASSYQGRRVKSASFDDAWVESLPDGRSEARGGGLTMDAYAPPQPSAFKTIYLLGAGCIILGVVVGWFCGWGLGLAIVGAGMTIIAWGRFCDEYPWMFWIPILAGCGVGVYLLVELYRGKSARTALDPIVQAIEAAPEAAAAPVKKLVAQFAGAKASAVKSTIGKVKRKVVAS
jgi:hypothetical protein